MTGAPSFPRLATLLAGFLLSVLIFLSVAPRRALPGAAEQPPALGAHAALRAEAYLVRLSGDPAPLAAQRSWKRMAPASLTKIMTVLVARERLAPDEQVIFSPEAKAVEDRRSDAAAGEMFLRDDAVRLALMESANDAALALAEAVGAQSEKIGFAERIAFFVRLMNERAAAIGMPDTYFENPTGLDALVHAMSAEDIARLVDYALIRDPGLFALTREREAAVFSSGKKKHTIISTNELLREFPAIAGGKTGFTDNAKGALLLLYPVRVKDRPPASTAVAQRISYGAYLARSGAAGAAAREKTAPPRKNIAIIVILKSENRFDDGRKIIRFLEENFP